MVKTEIVLITIKLVVTRPLSIHLEGISRQHIGRAVKGELRK